MFIKIFFSALLLLGALFPSKFKRITEFWRFDENPPTAMANNFTRIACLLAIVVIWVYSNPT